MAETREMTETKAGWFCETFIPLTDWPSSLADQLSLMERTAEGRIAMSPSRK